MNKTIVLLVVFMGLTAAVYGQSLPEPSFYVSFDEGIQADKADGNPMGKALDAKGNVVREVPLTEGCKGKALLSGAVAVVYATEGNLTAEGGTVVMWIRMMTWQPLDDKRHDFFATDHLMEGDTSVSHIALQKWEKYALTPGSNSFQLHLTGAKTVDGQSQVARNGYPIPHAITDDWQLGQWHFLAFTFDQKVGEAVLHADGVEAARARQNLPKELGVNFAIGSRFDDPASTAIDEVRIWSKPLTADQIRQLYLKDKKTAGL